MCFAKLRKIELTGERTDVRMRVCISAPAYPRVRTRICYFFHFDQHALNQCNDDICDDCVCACVRARVSTSRHRFQTHKQHLSLLLRLLVVVVPQQQYTMHAYSSYHWLVYFIAYKYIINMYCGAVLTLTHTHKHMQA